MNKGKIISTRGVWRKETVNYANLHKRVYRVRGRATKCEFCDKKGASKYEWANISGKYIDVYDYIQLCVSCHRKFDNDPERNNKKAICKMCGKEYLRTINRQLYCGNKEDKDSCSYKRQLEIQKANYANK